MDGFSVAIAGLTIPLNYLASTNPDLSFEKPGEALLRLIRQYSSQADLLILLTHVGEEEDERLARRLAETSPIPAVVVGGHSHTYLHEPLMVGRVPVVQAGEYGKVLGRLDLVADTEKRRLISAQGRLVEVGADIEAHPEMMARVRAFYQGPGRGLDQPIAKPDRFLSRIEIASFLARAIKETTGGDLALTNLGGFRLDIQPGLLCLDDLYKVFPFRDKILKARLSGRTLAEILRRPYEPGSPTRPLIFWPSGGPGPVDLDRTYMAAGNDYILHRLARALKIKPAFEVVDPDLRLFLGRAMAESFLWSSGPRKRTDPSEYFHYWEYTAEHI